MAELVRRRPGLHFDVYTEVPKWFFSDSIPQAFTYHPLATDIGLVQHSPLIEDLAATVTRLDNAVDDSMKMRVAESLRESGCPLVLADISPLGLRIAEAASVPSVLVENFTWDWVYSNYVGAPPRLRDHGRALRDVFAAAGLRIQTEPVCQYVEGAEQVPPVARAARLERSSVRRQLGVPVDEPMVVVSMGGIAWDYREFSDVVRADGPWIVIPGASDEEARRAGRLLLLPFHADIYHPDLVAASDVVVSKLGYSTVAEARRAGSALLYIGRPRFPESPVLQRWVEEHMVAAEIDEQSLRDGSWLELVDGLLERPRRGTDLADGAKMAAEIILEKFGSVLD